MMDAIGKQVNDVLKAKANQAVAHLDCETFLTYIDDQSIDLIYIDPPFNTGKVMKRTLKKAEIDKSGNSGFGDKKYKMVDTTAELSYADSFDNFIDWLEIILIQANRVLSPKGSIFVHLDYREFHYCKVMMDKVFGRENFINDIVWAYDFGGRSKTKWAPKHDNILWYAKDSNNYIYNENAIDLIPYMAPGLVSKEKAARGKRPTDVWWNTIVPTNGGEKTGYPTQKPLKILDRIVGVHSNEDSVVLDFFAGSGTTGHACKKLGRRFLLCDQNPQAIEVINKRLKTISVI